MRRDPIATYRLQLHAGFGFEQATAVLDYLRLLGVSHVYSSPCLQARAGSLHGYDVVNPEKISEELGGEAGRKKFCDALSACGLLQILDIVPNHMAIAGPENPWWWDVLENGTLSAWASFFDINWSTAREGGRKRLILPVLGDRYGRILKERAILPKRDGARFLIRYGEQVFPLSPDTLGGILNKAASVCRSAELAALAEAADGLFRRATADEPDTGRYREARDEFLTRLKDLFHKDRPAAKAVDEAMADVSADPVKLDGLLEWQHYRLVFWQVSFFELGYRRFFDINHLIALRSEDEAVFQATHRLVLEWLAAGELDGVRIDHIDGLYDPAQYLSRLRRHAPHAWMVVEKILGPDEELPADWNVAGTTGYDFACRVNAVLIDADGEKPLTDFYTAFTGRSADYDRIVHDSKLLVLQEMLAGDVRRLSAMLSGMAGRHWPWRDFTRAEIEAALAEFIACFPVYRSYIRPAPPRVSESDKRQVREALEKSRCFKPDLDEGLWDFLRDVFELNIEDEDALETTLRVQQLTGPAMAKGVEDTAFYRFHRLVSQNEVGGNPGRFGMSVAAFHRACRESAERRPYTMLATSTHDTKRSEDVRSRLHLLTEIPEAWQNAVLRWSAMNEACRTGAAPGRNTEYLFYQTLVGAWPISAERMAAYMNKAAREAKEETSWIRPDAAFEKALDQFVRNVMANETFRADLERFVSLLLIPAAINSLAQTLLKLTAPGVPDIYQGSELWDLSLVDPDNRRPVDFSLRRRLIRELDGMTPETIWQRREEGLPKLHVIRQTLALRQAHPEAFGSTAVYRPIEPAGPKKEHVIAFMRGENVMTVVPRLPLRLGGQWTDTAVSLPGGPWQNVLTGDVVSGTVLLTDLLRRLPVALLYSEAGV